MNKFLSVVALCFITLVSGGWTFFGGGTPSEKEVTEIYKEKIFAHFNTGEIDVLDAKVIKEEDRATPSGTSMKVFTANGFIVYKKTINSINNPFNKTYNSVVKINTVTVVTMHIVYVKTNEGWKRMGLEIF